MKFKSERDRMAHPLAKHIPERVWRDMFEYNGELWPSLMEVMASNDAELISSIDKNLSALLFDHEKEQTWLAIALSHPNLNDEQLLVLAQKLKVPNQKLLKLAAQCGNDSLFITLASREPELNECIAKDDYYLFRVAAESGNVAIIKTLIHKAPSQVEAMLRAKDYAAFFKAVSSANRELVELLINVGKETNILGELLEAENYRVYRIAASSCPLAIFNRLCELLPKDKLSMMLRASSKVFEDLIFPPYEILAHSIANPQAMEFIDRLRELSANEFGKMVKSDNYGAFRSAALTGNLEVANFFLHYNDPMKPKATFTMLSAMPGALWRYFEVNQPYSYYSYSESEDEPSDPSFAPFREAANSGSLEMLELFLKECPHKYLYQMISSDHYGAFRGAVKRGHTAIINRLLTFSPDLVATMISAKNYDAIDNAAYSGDTELLDKLIMLAPAEYRDSLNKRLDKYFTIAASNGQLNMMRHIIATGLELGDQYYIDSFSRAARSSHTEVMEYLMTAKPHLVTAMVCQGNYTLLKDAINDNRCQVVHCLLTTAEVFAHAEQPEEYNEQWVVPWLSRAIENFRERKQQIERADPNAVFDVSPSEARRCFYIARALIRRNDHESLDFILAIPAVRALATTTLTPNVPNELIRLAIEMGDLAVVERLSSLPANDLHHNDYAIFREAISHPNPNPQIISCLLTIPEVLAHAESHVREYDQQVSPWLTHKLASLAERKQQLQQGNLNAVFDLSAQEAKLCFYMARACIRRPNPALMDGLRFLLEIPAVKAIAATEVTPNQPNELLRLAIDTANPQAAEFLLTIPAINQLAAQNNYYAREAQGGLNLGALAANRESSMSALTQGEQKRLQRVIDLYQPMIKDSGVDNLIQGLRDILQIRYLQKPAVIIRDDTSALSLPMDWQAFQALNLSPREKDEALKAYYQHTDHSAWRYLLIPNPWMHSNASYVCVNPDNPQERWADYDQYKPFISMLFLAAQDEEIAPCDGYTFETRLAHFINELALIGRAHNWDDTRDKLDKETGLPLHNEKGEKIQEEYDNGQGDRPSCYSGMKRRLFQSVQGHPLLKILTLSDIQFELRSFVRDFFIKQINPNNIKELKEAWWDYIELNHVETVLPVLKKLDIPLEQQQEFISSLGKRYAEQFSSDLSFLTHVKHAFALTAAQAHLTTFAYVGVDEFLNPPLTASDIDAAIRTFVQDFYKQTITPDKHKQLVDAWRDYVKSKDPKAIDVMKKIDIPVKKQEEFIKCLSTRYYEKFTERPDLLKQIKDAFELQPEDAHVIRFYDSIEDLTKEKPVSYSSLVRHSFFASHPLAQQIDEFEEKKDEGNFNS